MIESKEQIKRWAGIVAGVREQIGQMIVGQQEAVEQMLWCLLAGGHALLEGIPGLGKTMLVRTAADTLDLAFSRIQFTPDLMPSDITGTNVMQFGTRGETTYQFQPGPIFGNLILADEINRATPKTQSALLEAMQEATVTVGQTTHRLPQPFFVLATQNPIENEGTYPLPEAQLDRFLLKIRALYPTKDELKEIVRRTTAPRTIRAQTTAGAREIAEIREAAKEVLLAEDVLDYAVRLLMATHPEEPGAPEPVSRYVRYGAGPRGIQAIVAVSKVRALMQGRLHVSLSDIRETAAPALRHRLLLTYDALAEGILPDAIVADIIAGLDSNR
ncbi:AAA family ATPase [Paenibacillus cymbidii]|uniref:AAA family ATPase n=1 Tax=Paenibacillus cymbidii TaxID=1639034 RepID=UPI001080B2FC|nr:AAA family ATPase [Paenibacillus cymbidii]